jgi:hypothetical protein
VGVNGPRLARSNFELKIINLFDSSSFVYFKKPRSTGFWEILFYPEPRTQKIQNRKDNDCSHELIFCKIDQLKQASSLILTFPSPPSALGVDIDRRGGLGACPHPESRIWAAVEVAGGAVTGSR